jgi:hypothetical protein
MMRIVLAAYALCAALVLMIGVGGAAPAEAGYYRYGYHGGGYYRGYRGYGVRTGYYGRRAYYGDYGYRRYDDGYRTAYYDRPAYRSGYYDSRYADDGYYDDSYSYRSGGYGGCHTAYIPYGWRWYRASSC